MAASDELPPLTFVVPGEPDQNTGGYRYVGRLVTTLNAGGKRARVVGVAGRFPRPDEEALSAVDELLVSMADQSCVILDGLAMGGMPEVIERHADRLVLLSLVHHPLADETGLTPEQQRWFFERESRALAAVRGIIATSHYTAERLTDFGVSAGRVRVACPGVDATTSNASGAVPSQPSGSAPTELLCVAHLSPRKAQLHLIEALSGLSGLSWHCTLLGSDQRDPAYAQEVKQAVADRGLEARIAVTGEVDGPGVAQAYRNADLFVFPSLYEGYGMVVDEALAAGLPVLTSDGGALARVAGTPGVCTYPVGDIEALTNTLRGLLAKPGNLTDLREAAVGARSTIQTWRQTAEAFTAAVTALSNRDTTVFAVDWLSLREPADHRARSSDLTARLNEWVVARYQSRRNRRPVAFADLGSGAGSNAMFLAPRIGVPQHWTLLDQDAALMAVAAERMTVLDVPLQTVIAALSPQTLGYRIPDEAEVITASALIDLVSESWLESLSASAGERRAAVFVVLSYSGQFSLSPVHPDDGLIRQLVNEHQHGNKGDGAALGPDAVSALKRCLTDRDYTVTTADSPWQLRASDSDLQVALLQGWCAAAQEQQPGSDGRISQWHEQRHQQALNGTLEITVGHQDLLAVPPVADHG